MLNTWLMHVFIHWAPKTHELFHKHIFLMHFLFLQSCLIKFNVKSALISSLLLPELKQTVPTSNYLWVLVNPLKALLSLGLLFINKDIYNAVHSYAVYASMLWMATCILSFPPLWAISIGTLSLADLLLSFYAILSFLVSVTEQAHGVTSDSLWVEGKGV